MGRRTPGKNASRFRIIAGRWRSRRLEFPPVGGVRPTPDRVRETLFNWLGPVLYGARGLDLFAGSGALGLEGLSRGMAGMCFIERDRQLAAVLRDHLAALGGKGTVIESDVPAWLRKARDDSLIPFDLVFLDPPWDAGLHEPVLALLQEGGWLAPDAVIYIEYRASSPPPDLPEGWGWHRQSRAGDVGFGLATTDS